MKQGSMPIAIKRTERKYVQLYTHKFHNLEETDQFLENHILLKLLEDET